MSVIHDCIKKEAVCFEEIETAELGQLVERCREKRVVLIGESTHGSKEYYRMRARLTEELVAKAGFTILACEGDWADFEEADRFVRGIPIRAVPFQRFPSWMWRNQDFFHFLDSIVGKGIRLYGLDLYGISRSIEALVQGLELKDPILAQAAREKLGAFHACGAESSGYYRYLKNGGQPFHFSLQELLEAAQALPDPQDELSFHILQNLRFLAKAEEAVKNLDNDTLHWNLRACQMFDALQAILEFHGEHAKAIVWAHNTHVGHTKATPMSEQGLFNIGTLCKEFYKEAAYSIGFGCYQGKVVAASQWEGPSEIKEVLPARPESYEHLFFETGLKKFSLYLQGPVREYLLERRLGRGIGTIYHPDPDGFANYYHSCLPDQFDEFVWFVATSPVERV